MSLMWQNTRAIHKNNLISVLANDRSQTHTQEKKKKVQEKHYSPSQKHTP